MSTRTKAWIFQAKQGSWDLNSFLEDHYENNTNAYFTVKNEKIEIDEGDDAYIWRATEKAGMVALGKVSRRPTPQKDIPDISRNGKEIDIYNEDGNTLKVGVKLTAVRVRPSDNYYTREEFKKSLVFSQLAIVTTNTGTVFPLNDDVAEVLRVKLKKMWGLRTSRRKYIDDEHEVDYPDEIKDNAPHLEGAKKRVTINAYERNPKARKKCLDCYGYKCSVCEFDFEKIYGELGKDYIHVHHLKEISAVGGQYQVDPINDLRPVCPNCHAMLHRNTKISRSIEELKGTIKG